MSRYWQFLANLQFCAGQTVRFSILLIAWQKLWDAAILPVNSDQRDDSSSVTPTSWHGKILHFTRSGLTPDPCFSPPHVCVSLHVRHLTDMLDISRITYSGRCGVLRMMKERENFNLTLDLEDVGFDFFLKEEQLWRLRCWPIDLTCVESALNYIVALQAL